jgi:hypothetical protein
MSLTKLTANLNIHQSKPDKPVDTAEQLKKDFDKPVNDIKEYINDTLTSEVDTELGTKANTTDVNAGLNGKAPNNHASPNTTYGLGTTSNYGHCKIVQSTDSSTEVDGEALGAYQGYYLKGLINDRLPLSGGTLTGNVLLDGEYFLQGKSNNNVINLIRGHNNMTAIGDSAYETRVWGSAFGVYPNAYFDSNAYFSNYVQFNDSIDVNANLYVNDHPIRAKYIYDRDTVTNSPNMYITSNGWIRRTTNTSSERYKTDIKDLEEELNPNKLYDLKIKQFKYKDEYQPNDKDKRYNKDLIGFIAEDVERVYPIAVDYTEDGQVDNWNERYIIPAMLKLIQDQKKQIDNLEERISNMEV